MALFLVNRYLGDDSLDNGNRRDTSSSQNDRAEQILKQIHRTAEIRKKQKSFGASDSSFFEEHSVESSSNKKRKKKRKLSESEPSTAEDNARTESEWREKIPNRERLSLNEHTDMCDRPDVVRLHAHDSDINISCTLDEDDSCQKKKRKKMKTKLCDIASKGNADTLDLSALSPENDMKEEHRLGKEEKKRKKKNLKELDADIYEAVEDKGGTIKDMLSADCEDSHTVDQDINNDSLDSLEESKEEKELPVTGQSHQEVGGFTVIGSVKQKQTAKVQRVLPDWLAHPDIITADIRGTRTPLTQVKGLDEHLLQKLKENGITYFFPVQSQVIPAVLSDVQTGFYVGRAGYCPRDICCSAPTGSGKTLAFVLPIIQALKSRVVCHVRALAVLPVRDLAAQVYKVFLTYCKDTNIKVGLLTGQKTFASEQQSLVRKSFRGYKSLVDIIVATPGRLVDHINKTPGFCLKQLRFLVIDEADRMMEEIKQDWLTQVEKAVYEENSQTVGGDCSRHPPGPITVANATKTDIPLQKLLFSATLSQNPEKLQQLKLFQPRLFTSTVKEQQHPRKPLEKEAHSEPEETKEERPSKAGVATEKPTPSPIQGDFVGKYTTPEGLSEYFIESGAGGKPLTVLYLLHHLKFRHVLCFTRSVEATHRLALLVKLVGGIEVQEFSSRIHAVKRTKMLRQFSDGKIDLLICSDAMARGMDVESVQCVVLYDAPQFIKTYIHRVGRTARAGKAGTAFTILDKKQIYHFKKMMRDSGKTNVKEMKVMKANLQPLVPSYQHALKELPDILKAEKVKQSQRQ